MRNIFILSILLMVAVAACSQVQTPNQQMEEDHIGCQEGEIDVDGNCIPAQQNNAGIFDQELEPFVEYQEVTGPVRGFIAQPQEPGDYPGVVMIHEWWGLNDNIKDMAKILAKEGYVVYAVDLYDGEVATDSSRAGELAGQVRDNPDEAVGKMETAAAYLESEYGAAQIGSIGWCFGGGQSLQLSLHEDIDATVIYYGHLVEDTQQLQSINGPVLGIFGEEDSSIPVSSVENFESSLDQLGIENDINIYPGVGHAFANPSGSNYAADATQDAWEKTVLFLDQNLKQRMQDEDSQMVETVTFTLTGENYAFFMDGQEAPELQVEQGTRVRIEFSSTDGFHDWVVDEFDAATQRVRPEDGTTVVEFVADTPGTFEYYCSVGQHRANGMFGSLVVT